MKNIMIKAGRIEAFLYRKEGERQKRISEILKALAGALAGDFVVCVLVFDAVNLGLTIGAASYALFIIGQFYVELSMESFYSERRTTNHVNTLITMKEAGIPTIRPMPTPLKR